VPHKFGTTVVRVEPRRVATYGGGDVDTLLALGVAPLLVPDIDPRWKGSGGVAPWSRARLGGTKPAVVSNEEVDFERVAEVLLPQGVVAPDAITVEDLVARGRYPHQGILRQWSREDEVAVRAAMRSTRVDDLAERPVEELSGGQRQRAWLAMVLAQETPFVLLDEPTTFLDIAHQVEVLDLCAELHEREGRTLVAVLHDLNHACRYATHLIAMADGRIVAEGDPAEIVDAELVERVFGLRCRVIADPECGTPLVVPAR
jgi:ABC-type cobalamin/Fe3+-siderophores transport system ATPase subunit